VTAADEAAIGVTDESGHCSSACRRVDQRATTSAIDATLATMHVIVGFQLPPANRIDVNHLAIETPTRIACV
jgi:hypothetical protein